MEQPLPIQQQENDSRAKEIDHGTIPLPMSNVMLGLPTKPGLNFDDRSSVSAIPWDYAQLVSQKRLLTTLKITPTTPSTTPIFLLPNAWDIIRKLHFRNLDTFFFLKSWKWHLIFQLRSNFQQVGMITISYVNLPLNAFSYYFNTPINQDTEKIFSLEDGMVGTVLDYKDQFPVDRLSAIYQLPHTLLMLGENQDVEVTCDWLSPFKAAVQPAARAGSVVAPPPSYMGYDMGHIRVHVPIPLEVATGVSDSTATIRIWSHLTDVKYSGYDPTDDTL